VLGDVYSLDYSYMLREELRRKENPLFNEEVCDRLGRCIFDSNCYVNLFLDQAQLDGNCVKALFLPWRRFDFDNSHREITRNENCTRHILQENRDEESKRVEVKSEAGIIKLDFSSNPKIGLDGIMNLSFLLYNNSVLRELLLANMRMGIEGITALVDIISSKHATLNALKVLDVGYNRLKNH